MMCTLLVASSAVAHADASGDAILAKVDAAMTAKTSYFEYEARTVEGTKTTTAAITVWMKGDKRLLEFTAPASMKGTKLLVMSPSEVYVYLPSFGKVRRVATDTAQQEMFGMAYTAGDWVAATFGATYEAKVTRPGDKELVLALTAKAVKGAPTTTTAAKAIELTVDVAKSLPVAIKWSGADGKVARTETFGAYTCQAAACSANTRTMATAKLTSTLTRKKWKANDAISDDVFSKRTLEK